jgi:amino acid permease
MQTWEAIFTVISTCLGAGIVFVPYQVYKVGIFWGCFVMIAVCALNQASCVLYMKAMSLTPFPVVTLYDLGFLIFRSRIIVYVIAILLLITCSGLVVIYFILFGDIAASIVNTLSDNVEDDSFLASRTLYVLIISLLLSPLFYTKKLKEMTVISVILVIAFAFFFSGFLFQLVVFGTTQNPDYDGVIDAKDLKSNDYLSFELTHNAIGMFSVTNSALLFQINLFPMYESLGGTPEEKRNQTMKTTAITFPIILLSYMSLSIIAIYEFGPAMHHTLLKNIEE